MGQPSHHPQDELLFRYASGELTEIRSLLVATHLAYCPCCRERVAAFEAQCGAWLDDIPTDPVDGSLDALLERLHGQLGDEPPVFAPPPPARPAIAGDGVPEPLRSWLDGPMRQRDWTDVVPGVQASAWKRSSGRSSAFLQRLEPGVRVPAHRHTATEMLLVLDGGFRDEYGQFDVGDMIEYEPGSHHAAIADETSGCICLLLREGEIVFLDDPVA